MLHGKRATRRQGRQTPGNPLSLLKRTGKSSSEAPLRILPASSPTANRDPMIDPALLAPEAVSDEIRAQNAEIVDKLSALPDPWLYPPALIRERRRQGLGPFPEMPRS